MRTLTLTLGNHADRRLALRIAELANIPPATVSVEGFTIHRNHITYLEIQFDKDGWPRFSKDGLQFRKKYRTIRNPLPYSAWAKVSRRDPLADFTAAMRGLGVAAHNAATALSRVGGVS